MIPYHPAYIRIVLMRSAQYNFSIFIKLKSKQNGEKYCNLFARFVKIL